MLEALTELYGPSFVAPRRKPSTIKFDLKTCDGVNAIGNTITVLLLQLYYFTSNLQHNHCNLVRRTHSARTKHLRQQRIQVSRRAVAHGKTRWRRRIFHTDDHGSNNISHGTARPLFHVSTHLLLTLICIHIVHSIVIEGYRNKSIKWESRRSRAYSRSASSN